MQVHRPDGTIEERPVSESTSSPDEKGNYTDNETFHIVTDASGTVMRVTLQGSRIFPFWVGYHDTGRSSGVYFQASSGKPAKNHKAGI